MGGCRRFANCREPESQPEQWDLRGSKFSQDSNNPQEHDRIQCATAHWQDAHELERLSVGKPSELL